MTIKEKAKKFYEEHEEAIILGAKVTVGVLISVLVCKKIKKSLGTVNYTPKPQEVKLPEKPVLPTPKLTQKLIDLGYEVECDGPGWMEIWNYASYDGKHFPNVDELHDTVEALRDIQGVTENSEIQAMFHINI